MSDSTAERLVNGQLAAYMVRVLGAVAAADQHDHIWWRCDGHYAPITFFVVVSDVFAWGTSDAEEITPSTVDALERAYADVREAADGDTTFGAILYASRRRGQRPQGAAYPSDPRLWPLFDACGPQREIDMFNPHLPGTGATPEQPTEVA